MNQFISYAQNYEDVMLWRALKNVQQGFYVDVGANDPTFDSVTQAFYERGWRGINIEPMQGYYEALCRERARDINLPYAIGAMEGELVMYEVPETGISSMLPDAVFNNRFLNERQVLARRVEVKTLDQIFEEYVQSDIHFLKIDVEGYEKDVLEGLDLGKWRPWILIAEATIPNSSDLNENFPEERIVSAGYTFVYFDGLNKYYVADEHAELRDAFYAPPNVFDYFMQNSQVKAKAETEDLRAARESEIARSTREIESLRSEIHSERKKHEALQVELYAERKRIEALQTQVSSGQMALDELRAVLDNSHAETEKIRKEYVNILYSRSYKITAPMRTFFTFAQRLKNRLRGIPDIAPVAFPVSQPKEETQPEHSNHKDQQYYQELFQSEQTTK